MADAETKSEKRSRRSAGPDGLIRCPDCNGTGTKVVEFKAAERMPDSVAVAQHMTCPRCEGLGEYYAAAEPSLEARLEGTIGYPTEEGTSGGEEWPEGKPKAGSRL